MTYLKQFDISDSYDTSVDAALAQATLYGVEHNADIISVAVLGGSGINNWKLIVAYKEQA